MRYSLAQLQALMRQAGAPDDITPEMAAISMAESSGNPNIVGTMAHGEHSVGLWQINIKPSLGRPWTENQLRDPLFNAQVALYLFNNGRGFNEWGAFSDGRYLKYLAQSRAIFDANSSGQQNAGLLPTQTVEGGLLGIVNIPIPPDVQSDSNTQIASASNGNTAPLLLLAIGGVLLYLLVD